MPGPIFLSIHPSIPGPMPGFVCPSRDLIWPMLGLVCVLVLGPRPGLVSLSLALPPPQVLPVDDDYAPALELKVIDHRDFGYQPVVGQNCLPDLHPFLCQPQPGGLHTCPVLPPLPLWQVYNCELEAVKEFEGLQDFCQTFPLYRGRAEPGDDPLVVGEFKGLFRIYPLPEDPGAPLPPRQFQELPPSQPQECLVRVYVVRAFNLPPKDRNGLCDPYIRVTLGQMKLGDRDDYVANTLEPVFGRWGLGLWGLGDLTEVPADGTEKGRGHEPAPGLSNSSTPGLHSSGLGQWRDQMPPTQVLEELCRARGLVLPEFSEDSRQVGFLGRSFLLADFGESPAPALQYLGPPRERLALHLLHTCGLVPEHVETRPLYSPTQPGIPQTGVWMMWVDIFPESLGPPGPHVDITPRKPKQYELRCIVWNTCDVELEETNIMGDHMSDIYVKGWLDGQEDVRQRTDVHYRSLEGEGSFNWRFIFTLDYLPLEGVCVLPCKEHLWSLDETVLKLPPKLVLQVWDNDTFSADDFLGALELPLTQVPRPAKRSRDCTLRPPRDPGTNLFHQRSLHGWWPCASYDKAGHPHLAGKLELTLELLTAKEAEERPAGRGREEPNMYPTLQPPVRPETSFLWFTAPLKTLRHIVWRRNRWRVLGGLALLLLALLLTSFVYASPVSHGLSWGLQCPWKGAGHS
uniref:C2 domain-containing protein n=1 Tax=Crocodylus porosus TaxID=8502 RepID=A0A7M4DUI5_CROPO